MEYKKAKSFAIAGTYLIGLALIIIKFDAIAGWIGVVLSAFKPLFAGIMIAFVIDKLVVALTGLMRKLNKKGDWKELTLRKIAIPLAYLIVLALIYLFFSIALPQLIESLTQLSNNMGTYFNNFTHWLEEVAERFHLDISDIKGFATVDNGLKDYLNKLLDAMTNMVPKVMETTGAIVSVFSTFIFSLIISIYLLLGKARLLRQTKHVMLAFLPDKWYRRFSYLYREVNLVFGKYIVGQLTEACILGTLCFIGMLIFKFDYALLISVSIAATALIPVLGAYIGAGFAALLLVIISPMQALYFLIYITILQQLEGNLIYPRVVGGSIGLPALWVLVSITAGGAIYGILGMLIAVPSATLLYRLLQRVVHKRVGEMVEGEVVEASEDSIVVEQVADK